MSATQPTNEALDIHRYANRVGKAGYIDPVSGKFVLTAHYLRIQRKCCGKGCRHCPYPPEEQAASGRPNVPSFPK